MVVCVVPAPGLRIFAIFSVVLASIAWTRCLADDCNIQYKQTLVASGVSSTSNIRCELSTSQIKWWRSREPCGGFREHSNCSTTLCDIPFNEAIDGNFYYCCTESSATDVLSAMDRDCYKLQVCTDVSMNARGATTAFFNEPVQIFIDMLSEPRPSNQTTKIFLTQSNSQLNATFFDAIRMGDSARWVWQYIVHIPDLEPASESGTLTFNVNYMHVNQSCEGVISAHVLFEIPVLRRRNGSSPVTPTDCSCTEPETTDPRADSGCGQNSTVIGLSIVTSLLLLSLVFFIVLSIVMCVCVLRRRRFTSSDSSYDSPSSYGMRPLFETQQSYNRVNSSASTVTTPASATTPLSVSQQDQNHPLLRVARGEFISANGAPTNGNHSPDGGQPSTAPPIHNRTLPGGQATLGGTSMATIDEEEERPGLPVYEQVNNNVPLRIESTDSNAVTV